jgi:hypothetical protein
MWSQLHSSINLAGNLVGLKVIEAWRAHVRKLGFQKMLDRICGLVLYKTIRATVVYKTIRATVVSRTARKKFQ